MRIKKIFLTFITIVLIAIGWFIYAPPYYPPRDYPQLADAERQRMDVKLFNELSVNGSWLPNYTVERRRALILDMAKQGFEVADLAYQLLDINPGISSGRHTLMPWEWGAYRHLQDMADKGDSSAQCLAALVIKRWQLDMRDHERYVIRAAEAGQPYCTDILSGLLQIHVGPHGSLQTPYWQTIPKDDNKGRALLFLAAKMGVQRAQLYLMSSFAHGSRGYSLNIGKAKCWLSLAEQADTGAALSERPNLNWLIQQAKEKGIDISEQYDPKQWCETKLTVNIENKIVW